MPKPALNQISRKPFVGDIAMTTSRFHSFHAPLKDILNERHSKRAEKPKLVAAK